MQTRMGGPTIAWEIRSSCTAPHSFKTGKTRLSRALNEATVLLMKDAHGHPLPGDDKVQMPVMIVIHPRGGCHHPRLRHCRSSLPCHVTEVALSVVLEEIAPRRHAVCARDGAPSDEEIGMTIAIEVAHRDS